ncbi:hypothetical protein [Pseudomonas sp. Gutcm_11s]|uniref:hypothetical protein n=1 Tax=Pseudomonas sp. Gutcm_11s TaxID=3026088 RepID=UPI002361FD66|nr:hypothetical protein [Pseudomonas sp. Gutcm_11s]MDD0841273.1 hypothetical protein [Pseudomonas sp. Gutcm_11s]
MKAKIICAALFLALIRPAFSTEITKEEREQFEQEFCGEAWAHFLPDDQKFTAENVELAALQHVNPDSRCVQNIEQKEFDRIYEEVKNSAASAFKDSSSAFEVMIKFDLTTSKPATFEIMVKDATEADTEQLTEFKSNLEKIKDFHSNQGAIYIVFHYKIKPKTIPSS